MSKLAVGTGRQGEKPFERVAAAVTEMEHHKAFEGYWRMVLSNLLMTQRYLRSNVDHAYISFPSRLLDPVGVFPAQLGRSLYFCG